MPPYELTEGPEWWGQWMRSVRENTGTTIGADGKPTAISKHLFIGGATAKNFVWRDRATPTEYWTEGGVRAWGYQKYRDWDLEGPYPLYLHEDILREHCYIVGPTGAGKSSLAIMPLLLQLIHGRTTEGGEQSAPAPIVILDLKGDAALFHTVRTEVQKRGVQRFKFFNLERDAATYRFNPFRGFNPELRSVPQLCQMMLDALALNHGRGYGRSYYTERSRFALAKVLRTTPNLSSFVQLHKALSATMKTERDKRARIDAFELLSVIETLTAYPQLVTSPEEDVSNRDGIIFMPDVLQERQVVYFWLPAALESISAGEIAKLVLFNLRAAAQDHKRLRPRDPLRTVLVIDELQRVAGENLAGILQDARSFGIGAILANQGIEDLKSETGFDLAPTVLTNTRAKFMFTSPNSGEYYLFVQRGKGLTRARPYPARNDPGLKENPVEDFAYTVTSTWPIAQELFDERDYLPLPNWDAIPGGRPLRVTPGEGADAGLSVTLQPKAMRDALWKEQKRFIELLVEREECTTASLESNRGATKKTPENPKVLRGE